MARAGSRSRRCGVAVVSILLAGSVSSQVEGSSADSRLRMAGPAVAGVSASVRERHAELQFGVLLRAATLSASIEPGGVGFVRPVEGPVSSAFGWRNLSVAGNRFHGGVDFAAATGTPVVAARGGRVAHAGWSGAYGYVVFVDHEGGWQTRYAHLSRIDVRLGDVVRQGSVLGAIGSTGASTGPHLHFEVRHDGRALDPLGFVPR